MYKIRKERGTRRIGEGRSVGKRERTSLMVLNRKVVGLSKLVVVPSTKDQTRRTMQNHT